MTKTASARYSFFGSNGGTRLSAEMRVLRLVAVTALTVVTVSAASV